MNKFLTFCLALFFVTNVQADTTDAKWKNIIEIKIITPHGIPTAKAIVVHCFLN